MSNEIRQDGYVNLMNKWGTSQDASEGYRFQRELVMLDIDRKSTRLTSSQTCALPIYLVSPLLY